MKTKVKTGGAHTMVVLEWTYVVKDFSYDNDLTELWDDVFSKGCFGFKLSELTYESFVGERLKDKLNEISTQKGYGNLIRKSEFVTCCSWSGWELTLEPSHFSKLNKKNTHSVLHDAFGGLLDPDEDIKLDKENGLGKLIYEIIKNIRDVLYVHFTDTSNGVFYQEVVKDVYQLRAELYCRLNDTPFDVEAYKNKVAIVRLEREALEAERKALKNDIEAERKALEADRKALNDEREKFYKSQKNLINTFIKKFFK